MRTKFLKFIAVLSMVLLAFNGCKKDEGEEPNPTPEPPIEETSVRHYTENTEKQKVEMFPDVVYVRNDINELLQENNIDNKTISFTNGEALKKMDIKVGEVLYSPFVGNQGYAVRIKSIEKNGNKTIYHYENVSPIEVFDKLNIKTDYEPNYAHIGPIPNAQDPITGRPAMYTAKETPKQPEKSYDFKINEKGELVLELGDEGIEIWKHLKLLKAKGNSKTTSLEFSLADLDDKKETEWDKLGLNVKLTHDFSNGYIIFEKGMFVSKLTPQFGFEVTLSYDLSQLKEFDTFKDTKKLLSNFDTPKNYIYKGRNWLEHVGNEDLVKKWRKEFEKESLGNSKDNKNNFEAWQKKNEEKLFKDFEKEIANQIRKKGLLGKKIPLVRIPFAASFAKKFNIVPTLDIYAIFEIDLEGELQVKIAKDKIFLICEIEYYTDRAKKILGKEKNFYSDFRSIDEGKMDISFLLDSKISCSAGLGLGVTLNFPWNYEYNTASYFGAYTDITLDSKLEFNTGAGITEGQGWSMRCNKASLSTNINWNGELDGNFGIFGKNLYKFNIKMPPVELKKLDPFNFDICKNRFLTLSENEVNLGIDGQQTLLLLGNEKYKFEFSTKEIADVSYNGKGELAIKGLKEGETTLSVTDEETNQTKKVKIKVINGEFTLEKNKLSVPLNGTSSITISKGSGSYSIVIADGKEKGIATAEIDKNGKRILFRGLKEGTTAFTVKDEQLKRTQTIEVMVTEEKKNLILSTTAVSLKENESIQVNITSGSGVYIVKSNNESVVLANEVKAGVIGIIAKGAGNATVIVKDKATKQQKTIEVTVTKAHPSLVVTSKTAELMVGGQYRINITSGSGKYSVSSQNSHIATASLSGNAIDIVGKSKGNTTVLLEDKESKETVSIAVKVSPKEDDTRVPEGVIIKDGVLIRWPYDKIPANGHITIPDGITTIGYAAFANKRGNVNNIQYANDNDKLISVKIPNSVKSINDFAFYNCTKLKIINIPNSVTSIGGGAFERCKSLTSITIPNSVTNIEKEAFYGCSSLSSITIPNSVTSIGHTAFAGCKSLTSITIPNSVTSIGEGAFAGCLLTSITIPNSVTSIGDSAFVDCLLTSITIPNSVTSIRNGVFTRCKSLTSITIPNSVTSIGGGAFEGCESLTSITIPNSVTSIGNGAFNRCKSLTSITIPNSVTSIGYGTFDECSSLTSITIPNSVTSIGGHAFAGCSLTSITIPNSVTSIGDSAFAGCLLTSITIPHSVTSIGKSTFAGCSKLSSITIPNSVTSIGDYAFIGCALLTSITIPNSVKTIGGHAFEKCRALTNITIPNSVTSIGNWAFEECESLKNIFIPNSVKTIGDGAFEKCKSLTSITIPNSVTSIGKSTFANCSSLSSITIPNSVTSIGDSAFAGCSKLSSITIPNSVTSIGDSAFSWCSSLSSITIPNSVTSIGCKTFMYCSSLSTVTIPNSVINIGQLFLGECRFLRELNCKVNTPPKIKNCSIFDVPGYGYKGKLIVPKGTKHLYEKAEGWKDCSPIVEED